MNIYKAIGSFKRLKLEISNMAINELSLIIPAHNEEKRILHTLEVYTKFFGDFVKDLEIIVVCNNSSDRTADIVSEFSKTNKSVRLVDIPYKIGKGGAILEGFKYVNYDYCGFIDADDAFELEGLKKMIETLDENDVVIASKWKDKTFSQVREPFSRKLLSRGWNQLIKWMFYLEFTDPHAGAKFFKRKAIDAIDKNFLCKGFEFDVELLWKFKKAKMKIAEVSVITRHMPNSSFSVSYIANMFNKLVTLYRLSKNLK